MTRIAAKVLIVASLFTVLAGTATPTNIGTLDKPTYRILWLY